MARTKEKILQAALTLFNENGLKNSILQTIADKVGISVGNLAYHYKNKQEIIAVHTEELEKGLKEALTHYRNYPNFLDFHIQLEQILEVLSHYRYIFTNLGEIKLVYPETFAIIQTFYEKLLAQIESRLEYHCNKGTLFFSESHILSSVASSMANAILFSQMRILMEPETDIQDVYPEIWNMIKPYFTDTGSREWLMLISPTIID